MKYTIHTTAHFDKWLRKVGDRQTKRKIAVRLARIEIGNFGDFKTISPNLFELRFFFGGGLRIYYTIRESQIVLLLVGGDKSSQQRDIEKVKRILDGQE